MDLSGQTAGGRGGKAICSYKDRGGTLITNTPKETKREGEIYPSISLTIPRSLLVSLGVLFPGVSIWMYEFVTDGSGTMDWLCCFVKDKGGAKAS